MMFLENFAPEIYNSLNQKEKKELIINTAHYLMNNLNLEPIDIVFSDDLSVDGKTAAGQHILSSSFIKINSLFVKDIDEIKETLNTSINYEIYIPYYVLHTIAHECYHHYQYTLTQKLINDEHLSIEDRNNAYLHFICLYSDLFMSLNDKFHFSELPNMEKEDLYLYSPIEIQANIFGSKMTDLLGKFDNKNNYIYYQNTQFEEYYNFVYNNKLKGGNLTVKTIEYKLKLALDFLDYKNKANGNRTRYLGIDPQQLEESVKKTITTWEKSENKQADYINKIFKK